MSERFDAIIIGSGIAGASLAYHLNSEGLKTLILDKNKIENSSSMAAGAFVSPKISKPSYYKEYINKAFFYTTKFYKKNFSDLFYESGLLKFPLNEEDKHRLNSYEPYLSDLEFKKLGENYLFLEAGIIEPLHLIQRLIHNSQLIEHYDIGSISYEKEWRVDRFRSKYIFIATPNIPKEFHLEYLKLKSIGGYRYDVVFENMQTQKLFLHKDISISPYCYGKIIIGATHIKESVDLVKAAKRDTHHLIKKAQSFYKMSDLKVLDIKIGYRVSTFDYLPIIGRVVDEKKTLKLYPYITGGTKVPSSKFCYYPNLFIHTALSSRGFVTALYNSKLIVEYILKDKAIDDKLTTVRLFKRWARKDDKRRDDA